MSGARPWALAGFSGSGKTTVARLLAEASGRRFVDLDGLIGLGRVEALLRAGEASLRAEEERQLRDLASGEPSLVVALGGGALLHEGTRRLLDEQFRVAWLELSLDQCLLRCESPREPRRPLLEAALAAGPAAVSRLFEERSRAAAHVMLRVDSSGPPGEVARVLLRLMSDADQDGPGGAPGPQSGAASPADGGGPPPSAPLP